MRLRPLWGQTEAIQCDAWDRGMQVSRWYHAGRTAICPRYRCKGHSSGGSLVEWASEQVQPLDRKDRQSGCAGLSVHVWGPTAKGPRPRRDMTPKGQDTNCESVSAGILLFFGFVFCLFAFSIWKEGPWWSIIFHLKVNCKRRKYNIMQWSRTQAGWAI